MGEKVYGRNESEGRGAIVNVHLWYKYASTPGYKGVLGAIPNLLFLNDFYFNGQFPSVSAR
jgi:hypothetical protein